VLNIARAANRWLPVDAYWLLTAYAEGNDVDVNRFKRAAPDQAMSAYWSKADLRWKRGHFRI
jgi:hypothetical protein